MDYGIFYGNILNFPLNISTLKNQGSNNVICYYINNALVGYPLKNQGSYNMIATQGKIIWVGYPLKNQGSNNLWIGIE